MVVTRLAVNFINIRLRDNQKINITDYSMMKWWRDHLTDNISPAFIAVVNSSSIDQVFPLPAGIHQYWQYIEYAFKNPRPLAEWDAFNHQNNIICL